MSTESGSIKSFFKRKKRQPVDPRPPLSDNYGTASFAPMDESPVDDLSMSNGVFLGKSSEPKRKLDDVNEGPGKPIFTTPENHTLIVARTRTGKGTRVIVPTLLRYTGSIFTIDPKGENAAITARMRKNRLDQKVHIVNPWGVLSKVYASYGFSPATYNPLDILRRDDRNAVAIARRLADAICPRTGTHSDVFWQQSAANVLTAVFLWLTDQPNEQKTLARAREIVTLSRTALIEQYLVNMVASNAFDGAIREMVGNLIDLADTTFTGITAHLAMSTGFISDPQLKAATNRSSFSVSDLRQEPTSVFLVIPPDQIEVQKIWLRLMIASVTQGFRGSVSSGQAHRCMMLIDEFPALGKLQDMPTDIATMSGYGLDYTLVIQGIDQLKSIYGDASGALLNNCAYQWYCNVTDLESAKLLSDILGEATVHTVSKTRSSSHTAKGEQTSGENYTWSEKGRRLLSPDEIINMGRDIAISLQPHGSPYYLKPIDYWNYAEAFARNDGAEPLPIEIPGYDDNPYHKGKTKKAPWREFLTLKGSGAHKPMDRAAPTPTSIPNVDEALTGDSATNRPLTSRIERPDNGHAGKESPAKLPIPESMIKEWRDIADKIRSGQLPRLEGEQPTGDSPSSKRKRKWFSIWNTSEDSEGN